MVDRPKRSWLLASLPATVSIALAGCAVDGTHVSNDTPIPGRHITQNAPAPDYTVFYWSALRACLQTGRSEWECKSGEDGFVRDALAVEAELDAQRRQRRQEILARSDIDSEPAPVEPERAPVATRLSQSLMFDPQPALHELTIQLEMPASLDLERTTLEDTASAR